MAGRLGEGLDLDAKQSGVFPDSRTEPRTAHEIVEQYRGIYLPRRYFGTEQELGEIEYELSFGESASGPRRIPRASQFHNATQVVIARNTCQVLGFVIGTEEKGERS